MHTLLQDLAVVMIVAALATIICHRFKLPVVFGYIIAGVVIGPHTPPYQLISDRNTINTLAELGVILLMFSLGLEFSLRKLRRVGGTAFIAAFLEILLLVWVGYEIGRFFGWKTMDSIFLGAILSISSSTIIVKVLGELGKTKERFSQLIFGILIIEDILAIAMIALLSGIATTGTLNIGEVGLTIGKLTIFLVSSLVIGLLTIPRLIGYIARFKSNEIIVITVIGLCFGFSLLATKLGYSVALGAFLIGAIIAEAREIHRIDKLVEPVRDMFSAIFFVTIGLLIDPQMLIKYWLPILVITFAVVVGKVLACTFGAFISGNDGRTSLRVGMGLAQIGEFSFIIASLGLTLKVTSPFLYPIAVAVSVLTTLLTPLLIQSSDGVNQWLERKSPKSLVDGLGIYTQWVGRLSSTGQRNMASELTRKWIAQMALNVVLMTAVFIAAAYVGSHPPGWLMRLQIGEDWLKPTLWLGAMILCLPMFIATFRKLQALGMLLAETKVTKAAAGARTAAIRAIVVQVVPLVGVALLVPFILILSSTLLPTLKVMMVLLLIVGLIAWLLWRSFIRVYSKAQIALLETLEENALPSHEESQIVLPSFLRDAVLETVPLVQKSPAVGKLIRELELRSLTGTSIIAIERNGASIINPGPDEELQTDDHILLLGTREQLTAATTHLSA